MPTNHLAPAIRSLPLSSFAPLQSGIPLAVRPRARAVLLSPTLPHRVLFNAHLVFQARRAGNGHIPSLVADLPLDEDVLDHADAGHLPSLLQLARALAQVSTPLDVIGQLLGCHKSEVSRLLKLSDSPALLDAVLSGRLPLSHAKRLAGKPAQVVKESLSGAVPTVREIEAKLAQRVSAAPLPLDPDTKRWIDSASGALGTSLELSRPTASSWRVEIAWTRLAVLQGILERLGAGNATDVPGLPERPRVLALELDSADELTALLQHLVD